MTSITGRIRSALRCAATVLALPVAAGSVLAGPALAAPVSASGEVVYVAMGDSFAAGSGIAPVVEPQVCSRSGVNYPSLVARELGVATFRDVTCGAARSVDFAAPQRGIFGGSAAPQYDALTADTTLVTVGIGGNDIGLVQLAAGCINLAVEPRGQSCADRNTAGGRDVFAEKIDAFAGTYGTVIEEIRARAPHAEIVLVGYPTAFRPGGCPDVHPVWARDADYVQARIDQLDAVMAEAAAAHGARYVDLKESTRDHDACAVPGQRWMEALVPVEPGATVPMHPNAAGHANTAQQVLAVLGG